MEHGSFKRTSFKYSMLDLMSRYHKDCSASIRQLLGNDLAPKIFEQVGEIANSEWELVTRPTAGDTLSTAMTSGQSREFGCANSDSRECSDATFGPIYTEQTQARRYLDHRSAAREPILDLQFAGLVDLSNV